MTNLCTTCRGSYDTVHMLMALPLLPGHVVMEGFIAVQDFYSVHVMNNLNRDDRDKFEQLFNYYRLTWLLGKFVTFLNF